MKTQRLYRGKDVYMLLAARTIVLALLKFLSELSVIRVNWTAQYVNGLIARIDDATEKYLGLDKRQAQRLASNNVNAIQKPAHKDLTFLKTQLQVDFKSEPDKFNEMMRALGYVNGKNNSKSDQEALIEQLYAFKRGMNDELKAEIIAKGTSSELIDRIVNYATELHEANQTQESLKETTKELTNEAVTALNGIYEEVIGICKIASGYYYDDPIKKEQFTYSHILANMTTTRKKSNGEEVVEEEIESKEE